MAKTKQAQPEDVEARLLEQVERILGELDQEDLAVLEERVMPLAFKDEGAPIEYGPQTPEELDDWFHERIGIRLAKTAVCPGHSSQFDIACEIYFFKVLRMLLVASRGGSKTSMMAWLDYCAAENFPKFESFTIGPGLKQGERKYEHMLPLVVEGGVIGGKELPHVARSTLTETVLKNLSKLGISPGTIAGANGPRAPRLHRDETELMDDQVYKQAGNIPAGRTTPDGRYIPAQFIDTSTMKWAHGRVLRMMEEYEASIQAGRKPRMEVRIMCIFEVAEEHSNCRGADPEARAARLKELGKDPCELCDCNEYVQGVWDVDEETGEAKERSLEDVCAGRLFKSRGFKPHGDITVLFQENERSEWEAEQECSEPSKEGVLIKSYSQVRNGLAAWEPIPNLGFIYRGVDWGGTDPHAVGWYQLTTQDVLAPAYKGDKPKLVPAGSLIKFAEIYRAGIGNVELGKRVNAVESEWIKKWPGWTVHECYPDPANAAGRLDWKHICGLPTISRIQKDYKEEVKLIRTRVGNATFFMVIPKCVMSDKAIRAWREKDGHEVHDWASHPMAEHRYVEHNLQVVYRKEVGKGSSSSPGADVAAHGQDEPTVVGPSKRRQLNRVISGPVGAEDSPLRAGRRSMDSHRSRTFLPR